MTKKETLRLQILKLLDEPLNVMTKKKLDRLADKFFAEWKKEEAKATKK